MVSLSAGAQSLFPDAKKIEEIKVQFHKFSPVKIGVDHELLQRHEKKVVSELILAAKIMDEIFLRQVFEDNPKIYENIAKNKDPEKQVIVEYFNLNAGPFDRLNEHEAFLNIGFEEQPKGAGFYPTDLSKVEWDGWLKKNPDLQEFFESNYSVIKRSKKGLKAISYSKYYAEWLKSAAKHLRDAAGYSKNKSLKNYLLSRADAFESNDYFQSDMDWMDLKEHKLEIVIGPYEVYEDRFMGYKAAFEAYISMVDERATVKLEKMKSYMEEFEANLPIDDKYKNKKRGKLSPIIVAKLIYSGGDAKAGIQTLAFNLPNDERVRQVKGSKKVLLKNVSEAKFNKILKPIAKITMSEKDSANISFDAFFNHTLLHEISHGIGPGVIMVKGKETTVNKELKNFYTVIEEAKADILGLYNNLYLIKRGVYSKGEEDKFLSTYLAGLFRSMRFGISEAHGGGNAIQFNYLFEKKAITYSSKTERFSLSKKKMKDAVESLAHELLMIEAVGSYSRAKSFVKDYRKIPKELAAVLAKLDSVPVDIRPIYSIEHFQK